MVINQLHSIGDLLFLQPMFRHFRERDGIRPIVPVMDHLMWLEHYIEDARFVPKSKFALDYESMDMNNPEYLPTRFANQIVRGLDRNDHSDYENMMGDKYRLAGLDPEMWKDIQLQFLPEKAVCLMVELGLSEKERFILVNEDSQAGSIEINPLTLIKTVKMHQKPNYNVLDWCLLMKFAEENHHISTCTFYILQALGQLNGKVFIYPRPNEDGLRGISKLNPSFKYTPMP
jgi:hypothetical protein